MPIITPNGLPVNDQLQHEGISVIPRDRAEHQDIRPLKIGVLNLMPAKQRTERQLARLLGHTALQVELILLRTKTYESKNEPREHLETFYRGWEDIAHEQFDGLIVTGAPVEHMEWNDVGYWKEFRDIHAWSRENVYARMHICWGAQAALQLNYGVEKYPLPSKAFGVYPHRVLKPEHPLVDGFDDEFLVPVSRNTEVRKTDVERIPEISIIAESDQTGLYLMQSEDGRDTYCPNHPEYGKNTLNDEYKRDSREQADFPVPYNYFPGDNPGCEPVNRWRAHARLLYANWLNSSVYQRSPFDLQQMPRVSA
jgi:homoserine O-succinyltransferase